MTVNQVRKLHQARPFRPFDVNLADGRSLPETHPELLAIVPPGSTIVVGLADGTAEIVDLFVVLSLKPHANGKPRRRRRE